MQVGAEGNRTFLKSGFRCRLVLAGLMLLPLTASADWYRFTDTAMTTPIELEFWADDKELADRVGTEVLAVFHQVDEQMSRYRDDSEVSGLNRSAASGPVAVSAGLFQVLQKAREVSLLSDGAFDITFGSVGYLYDFRSGKKPTEEEIRSGLPRVNFRDVILDQDVRTVEYRLPGIRVDLGGIAKGYTVDLGIERLPGVVANTAEPITRKTGDTLASRATANTRSSGVNEEALNREARQVALAERQRAEVAEAERIAAAKETARREQQETAARTRSKEELRRTMDANKSAIYSIYNRELRRKPSLQGSITPELVIEPNGAVSSCSVVESTLNEPALESKICNRLRLVDFGARPGVDQTRIRYPIELLSS